MPVAGTIDKLLIIEKPTTITIMAITMPVTKITPKAASLLVFCWFDNANIDTINPHISKMIDKNEMIGIEFSHRNIIVGIDP